MSEIQEKRNLASKAVTLFLSTSAGSAIQSVSASNTQEFDHLFKKFFLQPDYSVAGLSKLVRLMDNSEPEFDYDAEYASEPTMDLEEESSLTDQRQALIKRIDRMTKSDVMRIYTRPEVLAAYSGRDLSMLKSILVDWATKNDINAPEEWL